MMIEPVPAQWRQLIRKPCIIRLLHLPTGSRGLAGGFTGGNPAALASLRVGVAPSLLLRFRACFPRTLLPLSSSHRPASQLPSGSGSIGGCDALRVRRIRLRGLIAVVGGD